MSYLAPAAGYAVKLIELLSDEREAIGVSEISRKLELNKNMVFRLLSTLEQEGWVYCEKDTDSKYRLSLVPFQITSRAVRNLNLSSIATPYVYELWKKTGESTYLGIQKDSEVLYIQHLDSTKAIKVAGVVGGVYPLHCTAPGKALLAYCDPDFIGEYITAGLRSFTARTIIDGEVLRKELEAIRQRGIATDHEEYGSGIICLAAPIFDYTEKVVGTIGSSFSTLSCDFETMKAGYEEWIARAAGEISSCMGHKK